MEGEKRKEGSMTVTVEVSALDLLQRIAQVKAWVESLLGRPLFPSDLSSTNGVESSAADEPPSFSISVPKKSDKEAVLAPSKRPLSVLSPLTPLPISSVPVGAQPLIPRSPSPDPEADQKARETDEVVHELERWRDALADGITLCQIVQKCDESAVPLIHTNNPPPHKVLFHCVFHSVFILFFSFSISFPFPFQIHQNFLYFQDGCKNSLGLLPWYLFEERELTQPNGNVVCVIDCLECLARLVCISFSLFDSIRKMTLK